MSEWKMVRLGDISKLQFGYAYKSEDFIANEIPVIRIGDITENGINPDYNCCYSNKFWIEHPECRLQKNAVLIAMSGATVGKACLNTLDEKLLLNQRVAAINSGKDAISNFIFYSIKSDRFKKYVEKVSIGCAQPNISGKEIADFSFPLPSFSEQIEIATILDKCTELISKNKQMLVKYNLLIKSRFIEMFGDPVKNPMGWKVAELGDQCTEVRYGTSKPAVENGKYPYLRMNNITYDGQLDLSNLKYININDDELPKCSVKKGDVLFNRTNSIDLCGKTCLFNLDDIMVIAGYIIRVRLSENLNPQYVTTFFNTKTIKKLLREMAKGAINQANINAQEMQAIKIPIPPITLQNDFATFVQQIDKAKYNVQKSLEKVETLYKSLMQEYFG